MDRNRLIAVLLAIGGIVAIVYLSKRFLMTPASPYPATAYRDDPGAPVSAPIFSDSPLVIASSSSAESSDGQSADADTSSVSSIGSSVFIAPSAQALGRVALQGNASYKPGRLFIFTKSDAAGGAYGSMVRAEGELAIGGRKHDMSVFFRPRSDVSIDQLQRLLPNAEVFEANTGFGIGDEGRIAEGNDPNVVTLTADSGMSMKKFILDWGSGMTSDIAAYLIPQVSDQWFDAVLIDVFDVWPESTLPPTLNTAFVDQLQKAGDTRGAPYAAIDQIVRSFTF